MKTISCDKCKKVADDFEFFKKLEKKFAKGFDDFYNCYCIKIEDYEKIKLQYLVYQTFNKLLQQNKTNFPSLRQRRRK